MCDKLNYSVWYTSCLIHNLKNHSRAESSLNLVKFFMTIRDISIKLRSEMKTVSNYVIFPLCDVIHALAF